MLWAGTKVEETVPPGVVSASRCVGLSLIEKVSFVSGTQKKFGDVRKN